MTFGVKPAIALAPGQISTRAGRYDAPRRRLASVVVEDRRRIISGSLPAARRFPTEEALCREFDFSRTDRLHLLVTCLPVLVVFVLARRWIGSGQQLQGIFR